MSEDVEGARPLASEERRVLGAQIFCDDELGIGWENATALPEPVALNRINGRNETVLRALAMLEEHDESRSDDAERAELYRLEGKLNLALELLAELVRERQDRALVLPVRFNSRGLCWNSSAVPEVGMLLNIECYALPAWPVPLRLYARVASAQATEAGRRVCAEFEGLTSGVSEWLDKLVFRRHRREVALRRIRS